MACHSALLITLSSEDLDMFWASHTIWDCHLLYLVTEHLKQAGAELGQAQVIIEVLVEVGVTLMLKL